MHDGYDKIIKKYLDAAVKLDNERFSRPLGAVAHKGHLDVVEELLVTGADINSTSEDTSTPLQAAVNRGYRFVIEKLLAAGANVNTYGVEYSPLKLATEWKDTEIVRRVNSESEGPQSRTASLVPSGRCY